MTAQCIWAGAVGGLVTAVLLYLGKQFSRLL